MFTCQDGCSLRPPALRVLPRLGGSRSLETRPHGLLHVSVAAAAATLAPDNPLAVSPAAPSAGLARGLRPRRYSPSVPIDPAVVLEYSTRTFWALLVVVVTLLFARV